MQATAKTESIFVKNDKLTSNNLTSSISCEIIQRLYVANNIIKAFYFSKYHRKSFE